MVCFMCVFRMHASVFGREPCLPERRVSTGARRFCARGTAPQNAAFPGAEDNLLDLKVSADTLPGQHISTWPCGVATATVCPLAVGQCPESLAWPVSTSGACVPGRRRQGGGVTAIHRHQEPRAPQPWFPPAPQFGAHTASQVAPSPGRSPQRSRHCPQWAIASWPSAPRLLAVGA